MSRADDEGWELIELRQRIAHVTALLDQLEASLIGPAGRRDGAEALRIVCLSIRTLLTAPEGEVFDRLEAINERLETMIP